MYTEKMSISVPHIMVNFIEQYKSEHMCKSKSEVIVEALKVLQQSTLEKAYKEASSEIDYLFENSNLDGIEHDTW